MSSLHSRSISKFRPIAFAVTISVGLIAASATAQTTNTFPNSGNVGIGTTTPDFKLTVHGGSIKADDTSDMGCIYWTTGASNSARLEIGSGNGTSSARYAYLRLKSMETAAQQWNLGMYGDKNLQIRDETSALIPLTVQATTGNVGIGTSAPDFKLSVHGGSVKVDDVIDTACVYSTTGDNNSARLELDTGNGTLSGRYAYLRLNSMETAAQQWNFGMYGDKNLQLRDETGKRVPLTVQATTGYVGIGNSTPHAALDVTGDVNVSGNIAAKYQDVAEWVPASETMAPGTVVVLNPERSNEVMPSTTPYDTSVAGVVSARPGLILGEQGHSKAQIATAGRVRVKVSADRQPIRIGDLLVTSGRSGVAMKSDPVEINGRSFHQPGTIIGKALEPLNSGEGEILVLLSLQ